MGFLLWRVFQPLWLRTGWGRRSTYRRELGQLQHNGVASDRAEAIARELAGLSSAPSPERFDLRRTLDLVLGGLGILIFGGLLVAALVSLVLA